MRDKVHILRSDEQTFYHRVSDDNLIKTAEDAAALIGGASRAIISIRFDVQPDCIKISMTRSDLNNDSAGVWQFGSPLTLKLVKMFRSENSDET